MRAARGHLASPQHPDALLVGEVSGPPWDVRQWRRRGRKGRAGGGLCLRGGCFLAPGSASPLSATHHPTTLSYLGQHPLKKQNREAQLGGLGTRGGTTLNQEPLENL